MGRCFYGCQNHPFGEVQRFGGAETLEVGHSKASLEEIVSKSTPPLQ
jgi:hypothetical protein